MVSQGWEECFSEWRVGTGFKSHHEREEGDFCGTVRNGVMVEFGCGEEFQPFLGVVGTEDSEIGLDFLVGSFSLPISLRVVGGRKADIIVK